MIESIGYNKSHIDREENDFYATPLEEVINILQYERVSGTILEPCCGMGHMVEGIIRTGVASNIIATDLINRGYGITGLNFLDNNYPYVNNIDTIIINPPFKYICEFVLKSLSIANDKVILLGRSQFLESVGRYNSIFQTNPPNRIYQYVDRVACAKSGDFSKSLSANMSFSWFVWDKNCTNKDTVFHWIRRFDDYILPYAMNRI